MERPRERNRVGKEHRKNRETVGRLGDKKDEFTWASLWDSRTYRAMPLRKKERERERGRETSN